MQLRKKKQRILIDIFNVKYIEIVMGHKKDIISQKKQDLVKLFKDGNIMLEVRNNLTKKLKTLKRTKKIERQINFKNIRKKKLFEETWCFKCKQRYRILNTD